MIRKKGRSVQIGGGGGGGSVTPIPLTTAGLSTSQKSLCRLITWHPWNITLPAKQGAPGLRVLQPFPSVSSPAIPVHHRSQSTEGFLLPFLYLCTLLSGKSWLFQSASCIQPGFMLKAQIK